MASKANRNSARMVSSLVLGLVAATYGCGGDDNSPGTTGVGGTVAGVGGAVAGVGGAVAGVGGAVAGVGGAVAVGTTVAAAEGGTSSTDTTTSATTGGTSSTDTTTSATTGGTSSTGGSSATGGSKATGGSSVTGGSKATGGSSATGGSKATGGSSATGGATSTGTYDTTISTGEFSFFVISPTVIKANSPSISCDAAGTRCTSSLGGNLGGLAGADALCTKAAQAANPGDNHQWHAFLSTSAVNAITRIGKGPWYSAPPKYQNKTNYASEGLLFGLTTTAITATDRPGDSTTVVWNGSSPSGGGLGSAYNWPFNTCYTDETGVCTTKYGDSHDTNTGSTASGTYAGASLTCSDWTSAVASIKSKNGHSWCRSSDCSGMNWIYSSNESHPCLGVINMTTSNESTGIGSGGGYGGFYCFAVSN